MTVSFVSILEGLGPGLTPQVLNAMERLNAMTRLSSSRVPNDQRWMPMVLISLLAVLIIALLGITYNRIQRERRLASQAFMENVRRRNLSHHEYRLLLEVIRRSGLSPYQRGMILSSASHFERGASRAAQEILAKQGAEAHDRLLGELAFLREKLGFHDRSTKEWLAKSKGESKLTTRDIPVGKTLHITRRLGRQSDELEALVVGNDARQLTVTLERPLRITFGELWRARYYRGASVWEFDTAVVSFEGTRLILRHSNDVRFINRRRFVRVPAHNLAFVAPFPFARSLADGTTVLPDGAQGWKPVEFVHAVVTELAGPGLRIEAPLPVQVGQRLLIVFRLDGPSKGESQAQAGAGARLIEDIAVVRRIEAIPDSYSIALELVGLQDSDIDELVRATTTAARASGGQETAGSDESSETDDLVEATVAKER
jgi:hypothetical protein